MIIEHRTRNKHQIADSLRKKTQFCERQEQREADRPEIKDGFSSMDKEPYDSLPLTRWLDKSGEPIEDHPELLKERPEKTILKGNQGMPMEIVQSLVERIPDDILERTRVRKKKVAFKEQAEHLELGQESGEWPTAKEEAEEQKLSGECEEWDENSEKSSDGQDILCMILAEEKMRHRDRELQTDSSSGTYNLDQQEVCGGEELEKIAVSRKPFRRCRATQILEQILCQKMTGRS